MGFISLLDRIYFPFWRQLGLKSRPKSLQNSTKSHGWRHPGLVLDNHGVDFSRSPPWFHVPPPSSRECAAQEEFPALGIERNWERRCWAQPHWLWKELCSRNSSGEPPPVHRVLGIPWDSRWDLGSGLENRAKKTFQAALHLLNPGQIPIKFLGNYWAALSYNPW